MKIELEVRDHASAAVSALFAKQIPFATARAINDVALGAQKLQRTHMHGIFTVRAKSFVERAVKIKPFATKQSLEARISIDPPGGQARADILTKFETDRRKSARAGTLAVPIGERRTKSGIVAKRDHPRKLNFRAVGNTGRVMVGRRRTVLIRSGPREGWIFQRQGKGASSKLVPLWRLVESVPIEPDLKFVENVTRYVRANFAERFSVRFDEAVRTAR